MILREFFAKLGLNVDAASFAKGTIAVDLVKAGLNKLIEFGEEAIDQVKGVAEYGNKVRELAQMTGMGTDEFQRLGKAAAAEGIGIDDFAHSLVLLSRSMVASGSKTDEAGNAYHKLGIKVEDAHGKLRPTKDVLLDLADKFQKMPDGAKKTALALQVLGRSGATLIPLLNEGREGFEEYMKASVMSPEQIAAAREFERTQRALTAQTKSLWREAIAPLLPALTDLLKRFLAWKKANGDIIKQKIQAYVGYVITAIKALAGIMDLLIRNSTAVAAIMGGLLIWNLRKLSDEATRAGLKMMWGWIKAAAPFIAIGAVIAALMLIFDDLKGYAEGRDSLFGRFEKQLNEWLKPKGDDPWFVQVIKFFVAKIKEAIDLVREFEQSLGIIDQKNVDRRAGKTGKQITEDSDVQTLATARRRIAMGQDLTKEERGALSRSGVSAEAFVAKYKGGGGGQVNASVTNNMTIMQQPGESNQDLAKRIAEQSQSTLDGHLEDTHAQMSY